MATEAIDGLELGEIRAFDYDGKLLDNENNKSAVCKIRMSLRRGPRYYIKACSGAIYNANHHLSLQLDKVKSGISVWEYRQVNRACMQHYLNFLQTHDIKYLTLAVKEFQNG